MLIGNKVLHALSFEVACNFPSLHDITSALAPRGVLDQILDGDVPSRFQKHTRSLYQFFQNSYPTLYQFFKNIYPILYQFFENAYPTLYQLRNCENLCHSLYQNREIRYRSLYQNRENRYPSRWHIPVPKICIVPPPRISTRPPTNANLYYTKPPDFQL